ncbi:MAG: MarR family winged helix-turn-helix transcriptional regulator [Hyphomicrobiaceae bacterium]
MSENYGECACMNLRRTARLIAQFYDQKLQPGGLRNTQFTLLVTLRHQGPIAITQLADLLGLDRTTLTRNIRLLQKDGLISQQSGRDARVRLLSLSKKGETAIVSAAPHWKKAQAEFLKKFGKERWQLLRAELSEINTTLTGN